MEPKDFELPLEGPLHKDVQHHGMQPKMHSEHCRTTYHPNKQKKAKGTQPHQPTKKR